MGGDLARDVVRDLAHGVRVLRRNPLFTIATVATLALGIGLNVATFSTIHALLLAPLPGAEAPDELVQIYRRWGGIEYGSSSIPHYRDVRDRTGDVFENVAAWFLTSMSVAADDRTERVIGAGVSANFFQTYGVRPALGRTFLPGVEDRDTGAHPVIVLGHAYWRTRFGSDPGIVGRTVVLNGHPFEVVGVAPEDFRGPLTFADPPVYVPLTMQPVLVPGRNLVESRSNNMMTVVARLRDGATVEQAGARMDAVLAGLREEYPDDYRNQLGNTVVPQSRAGIHPAFGEAQIGMSVLMMAVVGLLLLIACVNVANLFLARARERRREMGIRLSLGAGRGRIVRQLLTESLVLALLAGAAGLGLAALASRLLVSFRLPVDGPWALNVTMDGTVLAFAFVVSLAAALLFGLVPALHAANPDTVAAMKGVSEGRPGRSRTSRGLVVAQVALSLVLLVGAGLFLRSLQGATAMDPGFGEPSSVVVASADPSLQGYDVEASRASWDRLLETLRADPAIREIGLADALPLGLNTSDRSVEIPGYTFGEGELRSLPYAVVSAGYLEAMDVPLLEGRTFTDSDDETGAPVVIVNRHMAERFWPGESAIGKIVRTAGEDRLVVGVTETGKYRSLGEEPSDFLYLPHRELFEAGMTLVARTAGDPGSALARIRAAVREADPALPLYDVRTMEDHMGVALFPARLAGSVLGAFGLLGLLLAAIGVYGVMAYSVAQRRRELGIRVALGADGGGLLRLVVGEGMRLALAGTAVGLVGAFALSRLVRGLLYGVSASDPVAFLAVPALLLAVAAFAVWLPARRAASVEPMRALRYE